MLLGGCPVGTSLTLNEQSLGFSPISEKFAYVGDAHIFVFDTTGLSRLDSIIPFCEAVQSTNIEEQKSASMLETSDKKRQTAKRNQQITDFIFNKTSVGEIWGGVGIAAFEWNPVEKDVLAVMTRKTNKLEIWAVD